MAILLIISGFAIVRYDDTRKMYVIDKFFIDPQYQGQGIAKSLLKAIMDNYTDYPIAISVFEQNRPAQHILIEYGFKKTLTRGAKIEYGKNVIPIKNSYYILERGKRNERNLL